MSTEQRRITLTQEDDGWWVAVDEAAGEEGVASQGETRTEALAHLDEAIALYEGESGESIEDEDEFFRSIGVDPDDLEDDPSPPSWLD